MSWISLLWEKNLVLYLLNENFLKKIIQVLFGMIKNLILNGIFKGLFYQIKTEHLGSFKKIEDNINIRR